MGLRRGRHFEETLDEARMSRGTRFAPEERVRTMPKLAGPGQKAVAREAAPGEGGAASPDDTSMWLSTAISAGVSVGGTTASADETATWVAIASQSQRDTVAELQASGQWEPAGPGTGRAQQAAGGTGSQAGGAPRSSAAFDTWASPWAAEAAERGEEGPAWDSPSLYVQPTGPLRDPRSEGAIAPYASISPSSSLSGKGFDSTGEFSTDEPRGIDGRASSGDPGDTMSWIALALDSDARLNADAGASGAAFSPERAVQAAPARSSGTDEPHAQNETTDEAAEVGAKVGGSAMLISLCVMISRITGFIRTWAMGFAMGTTLLSSSYQVACNLPNQLYELVMGGMLVTAFLPVYVSLRKRQGAERANAYASTLLGIVVVILGIVALLGTLFAPQVVYTQMFLNPSGDRELVTYFFRFFAIQLMFYGVSAIVGGLLNASRDYFWSSAAPIANNLVVIAVMFVYVFLAPANPDLGKLVIAIGTPLGVFTQMAIQIPALMRSGVSLRLRIDLRDPALRETLSLGIPTIVVTLASFATVSVQNAAAMAVSDAGSSVLFYARQWFTLPYAFLSVPLTTTLFTELSDMAADHDRDGLRRAIVGGTRQNLFFMIPFALYLAVFSVPLVSLFCAGSFTQDSVDMVAGYLAVMAISLPFYALFMFMQKVFSSLRRMRAYAVLNLVISVVQIVLTLLWCLGAAGWSGWGINGVALAQTAFFVLGDIWCYVYLRREFGHIGLLSMVRSGLGSLGLGLLGAAAGGIVLWLLMTFAGPIGGSIGRAALYLVPSGIVALLVTFGPAVALHVPEAAFIGRILGRFIPALRR